MSSSWPSQEKELQAPVRVVPLFSCSSNRIVAESFALLYSHSNTASSPSESWGWGGGGLSVAYNSSEVS